MYIRHTVGGVVQESPVFEKRAFSSENHKGGAPLTSTGSRPKALARPENGIFKYYLYHTKCNEPHQGSTPRASFAHGHLCNLVGVRISLFSLPAGTNWRPPPFSTTRKLRRSCGMFPQSKLCLPETLSFQGAVDRQSQESERRVR